MVGEPLPLLFLSFSGIVLLSIFDGTKKNFVNIDVAVGFGYNLAKGVKEAVDKDGCLGILTGGLKATAGGITATVTCGLLASLIFKAKDKA